MKFRPDIKTAFKPIARKMFWLAIFGLPLGYGYASHNQNKNLIVQQATSTATAQGYVGVKFTGGALLALQNRTYYACGTVDGAVAVYFGDRLYVHGRDAAADFRLRRLCKNGRPSAFF